MSSLREYDWQPVYESAPEGKYSDLVGRFYRPALERSVSYDRVAGYFGSGGLAAASQGVVAFVEGGGTMRLIVGAQLQETDRPVFEALADELSDRLEELLEDESLKPEMRLLAWLLAEERLELRVAVPVRENWGLFHPKMGIFDDGEEQLSFEGSVNETAGGWQRNFERFKVHRSWVDGQDVYIERDRDTFERLWNNKHPFVQVHEFPKALREDWIDWHAPSTAVELEETVEQLLDDTPEPEPPDELRPEHLVARGGDMPGGLLLADELAAIDPWPHQQVVSDTAVSAYPNGFMFCDEVGLGKTIEIGYTLQRLGLTGEVETALLLVPASLQEQWQEELWEKFNLPAYRWDRESDGTAVFIGPAGGRRVPPPIAELDVGTNPYPPAWAQSPVWRFVRSQQGGSLPTVVLMSWHTARLDHYHDLVAPRDEGAVRTRDDIPVTARGRTPEGREGVWDAVVVDEAHNARRQTKLHDVLRRLRSHAHCLYLATATPMQLHYSELHDLLSLLDLPGGWSSRSRFEAFFELRSALVDILETAENRRSDDLSSNYERALERSYGVETAGESVTEAILRTLPSRLEVVNTELVEDRVLMCCELAEDFGRRFEGYERLLTRAFEANNLDRPISDERDRVESLVASHQSIGVVSESDRERALSKLGVSGWQALADVFARAHPISAYVHRNTRQTLRKYERAGLLDESVPDREPSTKTIPLQQAKDAYEEIERYTTEFYKRAQQAEESENRALGFVMTTYRQRLTSSVRAIQKSLERRLDRLKRAERAIRDGTYAHPSLEGVDELEVAGSEDGRIDESGASIDDVVPVVDEEGRELMEDEIEALQGFVSQVRNIGEDPKLKQLREDLRDLENSGHDRVLIFTQYTDTLEYVRDALQETFGTQLATFTGDGAQWWDEDAERWVSISKEQVKRSFAEDGGRVEKLLGTSAMSEGLNLQFCGVVINYDLPWNPMKVEQRIGRIDRIGQRYDTIQIINYKYEDSIDGDIYDALEDRIDMFESVVGEVQPIVRQVEGEIRDRAMEGRKPSEGEGEQAVDEITAETELDETVDVPETLEHRRLDEVDPAAGVRREARLTAWSSWCHPDLDEIGVEPSALPPYDVVSLEAALVDNDRLADTGVAFKPLPDGDYVSDVLSEGAQDVYLLELPNEWEVQPPPSDTAAETLCAEYDADAAVTFEPQRIEDYPSLRLVAPGEELFDRIIQKLDAREAPETANWMQVSWARIGKLSLEAGNLGQPIIGGFFADGLQLRLEDGQFELGPESSESLEDWARKFLDLRG